MEEAKAQDKTSSAQASRRAEKYVICEPDETGSTRILVRGIGTYWTDQSQAICISGMD
jgi:hypothetical protein